MSYSKYTEHGVYTYTHICFGGQTVETCPTLCQSEFGTAVLLFFAGGVGSQSIRQLMKSEYQTASKLKDGFVCPYTKSQFI